MAIALPIHIHSHAYRIQQMPIFAYQRSRLSFCCLFSALESNRLNGLVPLVGSNTKITQKCHGLSIAKVSVNLSIVMDQKKNFQLLFFFPFGVFASTCSMQ